MSTPAAILKTRKSSATTRGVLMTKFSVNNCVDLQCDTKKKN